MTRPTLEMVSTPLFRRVHYRALEAYLSRVYRLRFSVLKTADASHGISPEYLIEEEIPPHLQADANQLRAGARCRNLKLALTVLCADKLIPEGLYLVDLRQEQDSVEAYESLLQRTLDPLYPECVNFKAKHRSEKGFQRRVQIIDKSLIEWLKKERPEEL